MRANNQSDRAFPTSYSNSMVVTWEGSVWRQGNFRRGFSYQTATPAPLWHGHAPWNQDAEERTKRYLGRAGRSEQRQAELKGGWSSLCYFINSWGSLLVLPQRAVENPCRGCVIEAAVGGTLIGLASSIQIYRVHNNIISVVKGATRWLNVAVRSPNSVDCKAVIDKCIKT